MTHESLLNDLWHSTLARLGGDAAVEASAREKGAFARARGVASAADLLRPILGYCLGGMGLRSTSAWAASVGLADLSNVALLKRLRKCGPWMEHLAGLLLSGGAQPAAQGRRIRLVDGTTVPKAGREAKKNNGLWRLHCAFDLPAERFSFIALTDEKGGERLDRVPFAKGDIAIADRGYMHPDSLAHVLEQGADIIVRTPWRGARWYGKKGRPFDLLAALAAGETAGVIDRSGFCPKRPRLFLSGLSLCASPNRRRRRRGKKRGLPRNRKATPSPPARSSRPNGLFSSPRSMQKPSRQQKSQSFTAPAGASRWRLSA